MRTEPTWRIPVGILALLAALGVYGLVVARYVPEIVGEWHALAQTVVYVFFGLLWLVPMKPYLAWMETGHWGGPPESRKQG